MSKNIWKSFKSLDIENLDSYGIIVAKKTKDYGETYVIGNFTLLLKCIAVREFCGSQYGKGYFKSWCYLNEFLDEHMMLKRVQKAYNAINKRGLK